LAIHIFCLALEKDSFIAATTIRIGIVSGRNSIGRCHKNMQTSTFIAWQELFSLYIVIVSFVITAKNTSLYDKEIAVS